MAHTHKLILEENIRFSFRDTMFVLLKTSLLNNEFVLLFNKAYQLQMARVDDVIVEDTSFVCFSYYDKITHMSYFMLERNSGKDDGGLSDYYDKLLIIRGHDAARLQQFVYNDLSAATPEPDPTDLLGHSVWEDVRNLRAGIFAIDTLSYPFGHETATSICPNAEDRSKKLNDQLKKYNTFLTQVFAELNHLLPDD